MEIIVSFTGYHVTLLSLSCLLADKWQQDFSKIQKILSINLNFFFFFLVSWEQIAIIHLKQPFNSGHLVPWKYFENYGSGFFLWRKKFLSFYVVFFMAKRCSPDIFGVFHLKAPILWETSMGDLFLNTSPGST